MVFMCFPFHCSWNFLEFECATCFGYIQINRLTLSCFICMVPMSYALFPCWVSFQLGKHPISFCSRRSEPLFPASRLELLHQSPLWKSCLSSPATGAPMSHGEVFLPWIAVAVAPIWAPNWCCLVWKHHKPSHLRVKRSKYWFFTVC